jgi:hypothetical protein
MEGAPVVKIVAVPQLTPCAAAPLKRQRRACMVAVGAIDTCWSGLPAGLRSQTAQLGPCLHLPCPAPGHRRRAPGSPWLPPHPQV